MILRTQDIHPETNGTAHSSNSSHRSARTFPISAAASPGPGGGCGGAVRDFRAFRPARKRTGIGGTGRNQRRRAGTIQGRQEQFPEPFHRARHPSGRRRAGYGRGHGNPLRRPRRGASSSPGWPRSGGSARPDRRLHLREGKPGERQASRPDYRGTAGIAAISRPEVRRYAGSGKRAFSQHANVVGLAAECGTRAGGGQRRPAPFAARHRPAEEPLPVHAESRASCSPKPTC